MKKTMLDLKGLPAADRVERGVRDLNAGHATLEALWISAATRRLRDIGLPIREGARVHEEPELAFYQALGEKYEDAYSRYNSMRRELDSFMNAAEGRLSRARRKARSST